MHKICLSLLLFIMSIGAANAVRVHGRVITADDNEPAIGASIQAFSATDTTKNIGGVAADIDGRFDFNVPNETKTVRISYIGTSPQTFSPSELNGRTITLQDDPKMLGEVTVIGHRTSDGGDGCDKEENDRISPTLALCSVHAYNIGQNTNPAGADKQLMKDVVALKTTVIAQQMNKQYDYMEAMIRRFRTQLEKAVLTTKLQAAGATSASGDADSGGGAGSYGYGSGSGGVRTQQGLANAEDCIGTATTSAAVMQCLLRNVAKIQSAVTSGDIGAARRQLATDRTALLSFNNMTISCAQNQPNCSVNMPCENALAENKSCDKAIQSGSTRNDITTCVGQFRACVVANSDALQSKNTKHQQ